MLTLFFCVGFSCGWNLVSLIFTSPFRNNEQIHVYYSLKNTTKIELEATIRSKVHCTSVNVQARSSTYLWACTLWTQQSRQATGLHSNAPTSALSAATSFLSHSWLTISPSENPPGNSTHWPCFITVVSGADSGSQHQHFPPLVLKAHLSPHVLQWVIQTLLDVYEGYLTRNSADFIGSLIIAFVASFTKS